MQGEEKEENKVGLKKDEKKEREGDVQEGAEHTPESRGEGRGRD